MRLEDTPEEAAFRAVARSWLERAAPARGARGDFSHGYGRLEGPAEHEFIRRSKAWQARLVADGWAGITWPVSYGGRGGTALERLIFAEEASQFGVSGELFDVGINIVGPALIDWGSDEQRQRFLPPMLAGTEIWCQLFSEPDAGSDLAGLRTAAVRDGEDWVVNGQKVWTSGAHYSDFGMLLARSDPDVPKHRGITCFLVDMRSKGIELRPLRQMTGAYHFSEVFMRDVWLGSQSVLGPVDQGWAVTVSTLTHERSIIGGGHRGPSFDELVALAWSRSLSDDPLVRQRIASAYIDLRIIEFMDLQFQTTLSNNAVPGPETSLKKLFHAGQIARMTRSALSMKGAAGMVLDDRASNEGLWVHEALNAPLFRIAGGTDEVQRNILESVYLACPWSHV